MSARDLFTAHAEFLLDSDFGFGEELLHIAQNGTQTPFSGIWDQADERGQLRMDRSGDDKSTQHAAVDVPIGLAVNAKDWIRRNGEDWTVTGIDGRDDNLKTVSLIRNTIDTRRRTPGR